MPAVALIRSDIEPVSDRIFPDAGRYFTHVWLREDKRAHGSSRGAQVLVWSSSEQHAPCFGHCAR